MHHLSACASCSGPSYASTQRPSDVRPVWSPMDSISSRTAGCLSGRQISHSLASTSGREATRRRGRSRLQVDAALFEPPPFQPAKLSVDYLPGAAVRSASLPSSSDVHTPTPPQYRRYTLTHNDITGALQLSIGSDFNQRQVDGFYTRILRDEITAEWLFGKGSAAPAELHIYCHVSGDERWLAPPQLRNFIFRREMTLVLDTFVYADKQLLQAYPELLRAKVYVHFQSDVQDLDLREYWGVLGDRRTWRRMPKGVLTRLKLLLFGFPALPHSRPRHALTQLQQQRQLQQEGQQPGVLVAAAATAGTPMATAAAAADSAEVASSSSGGGSSGSVHHQWHPHAELAVEATRSVALSLQEQRQAQAQQQEDSLVQQPQPPGLPGAGPHQAEPCGCCDGAGSSQHSNGTGSYASISGVGSSATPVLVEQQQQCLHPDEGSVAQAPQVQQPEPVAVGNGSSPPGPGAPTCSGSNINDGSSSRNGTEPAIESLGSAGSAVEQQQQWQLPAQQRLQKQLGQMEQAAMVEALMEYGRWSAQRQQQSSSSTIRTRQLVQAAASNSSSGGGGGISSLSSSSSGGIGSNSSVLSAAMLGGPSALQLVLQQQQEQMLLQTAGCAAVVLATANAVVDASSSTAGRCQ